MCESVVQCEFPLQTELSSGPGTPYSTRIRAKDLGNPHPGVIPSPSISLHGENTDTFWNLYYYHVDSLLYEYNWHDHQATCWKTLKASQKRTDSNCRMGMDGVTRPKTIVDDDTFAVLLRRLHPRIASFNDLSTFLLKCNINFKAITSGEAAKAYMFYLTDYVTKYTLPTHVGMAALLHAIQKTNARIGEDLHPTDKQQVGAVTTAVNSMMGKQEISHQQVMSYLIGGGDHYTSHQFQVVHWGSICQFVDSKLPRDDELQEDYMAPPDSQFVGLTLRIQEIYASSQLLDYIHRGTAHEFESLCLYRFFAETRKRRIGAHIDIRSERPGFFSSWDHPQRVTHELHFLRTHSVPVLLGPSIPNPHSSKEAKELWAKFIMILFKPWRNPLDLKSSTDSWLSAYSSYEDLLHPSMRQVIQNMTVLSESRDAREQRHAQSVQDDLYHEHIMDPLAPPFSIEEGTDDEDILPESPHTPSGIFQSLSHLFTDPERTSKILESYVDSEAGRNISRLLDLCSLPSQELEQHTMDGDVSNMTTEDNDITKLHAQKMKDAKKRSRSTEDAEDVGPEAQRRRIVTSTTSPIAERAVLQSTGYSWKMTCSENEADVVKFIAQEFNLLDNPEQMRAFMIVADRVITRSKEQLLLYVSGVGGTGKSHVIKAIVALFRKLDRSEELALAAPTGIAAVLIGGQTLHSLIMLSPNQNKSVDIATLTARYRYIGTIILDEVSMIDARLMESFSKRLRLAKGEDHSRATLPFGGLNVIFTGDFGQLKPPIEQSLYSYKALSQSSFSTSIRGQQAMAGVHLWRQVQHVVELVQNRRQASDLPYAAFLCRLRVGACISSFVSQDMQINDFQYLQPRLLSNLSKIHGELSKFQDAPVIVGSKSLRDVLNAKLLVRHASRLRRNVHVYYSSDTSFRKPVKRSIRKKLWDLHSSYTLDSLGCLPMFPGMRVMITENLAFDYQIVNGKEGTIKKIKYTVDGQGRRTATVVYVYVEGCNMNLTGTPEDQDVVPIFPTSRSVNAKIVLKTIGIRSFSRKQIPLLPAYAYTDYKSQGRSLSTVIVDLMTARGQSAYVMLSRVRSLSGLAILRPFPETKIFTKLSGELRCELTRLDNLSEATRRSMELYDTPTTLN